MAEDALTCLASLLEKIPAWIEELKSVNKPSVQGLALPSHRPDAAIILAATSARRHENGGGLPQRAALETVPLTPSDALRLSQRKRKTFSACSGDASGPAKFRSKHTGVVQYDGTIQKSFEEVVRNIAASRSVLKRGRMTARIQTLSRTGSSDSETSKETRSRPGVLTGEFNRSTPTLGGIHRPDVPTLDDLRDIFDPLDKHLDKAQALCERAAHQILRDGDCMLEVDDAKTRLTVALEFVTTELPNAQRRSACNAERRRDYDERRRTARTTAAAAAAATAAAVAASQQNVIQAKLISAVVSTLPPANAMLEVDDMLVDDDSDEDDYDYVWDSTPFAMLAKMRPSGLTAH